MKFIDGNGRLFGKVNIIDFLLVSLLLFFLPMFYFGYKLAKTHSNRTENNDKIVIPFDMYVCFKNIDPATISLIRVGDRGRNMQGNIVGEILEICRVSTNFIEIRLSETEAITKADNQRKQITLKIRLWATLTNSDILYEGRYLRVGSDFVLTTDKYQIRGAIQPLSSQYEDSDQMVLPINLSALFENLSPEVANLISTGDFELDKNGNTVAKILSVGAIEPYTYTIDLGGGNYVTKVDPQKKQVQAKLEILGSVHGSAFYFKGDRIAMDSKVVFNSSSSNDTLVGKIIRDPSTVKNIEKKWAVVKTKFKNLPVEVADAIKENDVEKNISGEVIAKVVSICSASPAETFIPNFDADKLIFTKEQNKDVVILLKMHCVKAREGLSFKEIVVRLNTVIPFQTDKYSIAGRIIEINEVANE